MGSSVGFSVSVASSVGFSVSVASSVGFSVSVGSSVGFSVSVASSVGFSVSVASSVIFSVTVGSFVSLNLRNSISKFLFLKKDLIFNGLDKSKHKKTRIIWIRIRAFFSFIFIVF